MSTHETHDHTGPDHSSHDHAGHDHEGHDHSGHDHEGHDHEGHDHSGHDHDMHGADAIAGYKRRFWISLALTAPVLVFSTGLQNILGLDGPRFPGSQWIPAVFGVAIFVVGGVMFLQHAWMELRMRQPGMMTLIALAVLVSFGYSLAVTLGLQGMDFWWELATLIDVMLLGHWIEALAVQGAQNALGELAKLLPDEVERVADADADAGETVALSEVGVGDLLLVRPGATVPADGRVVHGESQVDESLLTGESAAVAKATGDEVVGGSVVSGGAITVEVTKLGDDSALGGIMRLVADAQSGKSGSQLLADRAAKWLFFIALGAAIVTAVVWLLIRPDDLAFVLERVVTVLVIACPHALGLAIPLVALLTTSIGARRGVLIRNRAALEEARRTDMVVFDKTGTLTEGRLALEAVATAEGQDEAEVLALAAAVEARAEHPISRAIVAAAEERGAPSVGRATRFRSLAGRGVTATVGGRELTVGGPRMLTEGSIRMPAELVSASRELATGGAAVVTLLEGETVLGVLAVRDTVRAESAQAVRLLRGRGIRVAMLTGDAHAVAERVAKEVGIDEVHAEVLPDRKADVVNKLQRGGTRVAMVGDGVNDAPALATADLGIAIGAGTDVAIESAGVVLASSDPRGVVDTLHLSRAAYRKMLQNLAWATGYNAIGLPLAAGVLAGVGFVMPPAVGALVMSVSTVVVALNAQLLRLTRFSR